MVNCSKPLQELFVIDGIKCCREIYEHQNDMILLIHCHEDVIMYLHNSSFATVSFSVSGLQPREQIVVVDVFSQLEVDTFLYEL